MAENGTLKQLQSLLAVNNDTTSAQGYAGQPLQTNVGYYYQNPYYYSCTYEHAHSDEEKLILIAFRKDPSLKDKTVKFILSELLKSLG